MKPAIIISVSSTVAAIIFGIVVINGGPNGVIAGSLLAFLSIFLAWICKEFGNFADELREENRQLRHENRILRDKLNQAPLPMDIKFW